jgi:hypothetical protein
MRLLAPPLVALLACALGCSHGTSTNDDNQTCMGLSHRGGTFLVIDLDASNAADAPGSVFDASCAVDCPGVLDSGIPTFGPDSGAPCVAQCLQEAAREGQPDPTLNWCTASPLSIGCDLDVNQPEPCDYQP